MIKFKIYDLDLDKTLNYVKSYLAEGNVLSEKIIDGIDFSKGSFSTVLTTDSNLSHIYKFDEGGILPQPELHTHKGTEHTVFYQKKPNADLFLIDYIINKINKNEDKLWIFEDVLRVWNDINLTELKKLGIVYNCDSQIYYILDKNNCRLSNIKDCINKADAMWHFLCIFTSSNFFRKNHFLLNSDNMSDFVQKIDAIVLGAYDGESYIFWEKDNLF